MLARKSVLNHPLAGPVDLPLLVPAFSSKGFPLGRTGNKDSRHDFSYAAADLVDFAGRPSNSVLISAYDLHFRHFEAPRVSPKNPIAHLRKAVLVFVDSGGYELAREFDSTEPKQPAYVPKTGFNKTAYLKQLRGLASLPEPLPLVITNFDWGTRSRPFDAQIAAARELFRRFPDTLHDFVIKPGGNDPPHIDPGTMSRQDFQNLRGFHIIGVTEKELGPHLGRRLERIAALRSGLNAAGIDAPIHVWGGLDPLVTPLYFFAGAEIFDGLSWLRYAFVDGIAINRNCSEVILDDLGAWSRPETRHALVSLKNLQFLENSRIALQQWYDSGGREFSMFPDNTSACLKRAFRYMQSQIEDL